MPKTNLVSVNQDGPIWKTVLSVALLEAMVVSVLTAPHVQFLCHILSHTIIETGSLDGFFLGVPVLAHW